MRFKVCLLAVVPLLLLAAACSAQLDDAITAHRTGKYDDAIAIYRRALAAEPASLAARKGLARALADIGKYADAEGVLREAPATIAPSVATALGDVQRAQGKLADAETAYRAGLRSADSLTAKLNLAILAYRRGEKSAALDVFDTYIDVYNRGADRLTAEEIVAVGTAVRYLGERDPQLFKDALNAYDEAAAKDPNNEDARLLAGELFLEKYRGDEAEKTFQAALQQNPRNPRALVDLARSREFDGSAEAVELARKALEVNPNLVDAHLLLARNSLGVENRESARQQAEQALAADPSSLEALSLLAAAHHFADDRASFDAVAARIRALNPRYAELYTTLADISVQTRRYAPAVEFARRAIALDSTAWRAHGVLGINLMRLGAIAEGRASLELAFRGDPYNAWFKNTLDLLDTFSGYRTVRTPHYELFLRQDEADLLEP
ncbi:MAG TPA: tetratricopeptide repeat protein, partial [Longimicrobiales bacterium]|nr:tetratricopeptide repeat protein [Longimicrobiales bacterium]